MIWWSYNWLYCCCVRMAGSKESFFWGNFLNLNYSSKPRRFVSFVVNKHLIDYPTPVTVSYFWGFGSLAGMYLIIQLLTGFILTMHYVPHISLTFLVLEHIMRDVNWGSWLRYLHANGASFFFIVVYIHIGRGLFFFSYLRNSLTWITGIIIFFLMMAAAFMGYVLPWGQMSFWGATVITNLFSAIPGVGNEIATWLWGGFSVGNPTLNRFFSLHFIVPFAIAAVAGIHLIFLHKVGSGNAIGIYDIVGDKLPFYPYFYWKDMIGFLYFMWFYFFIVSFFPNLLGHPDNYIEANPSVTPTHIVPEWYFLSFYAVLRSIPNKILGVIFMVLAILIFIFLSFLVFPVYYNNKLKGLGIILLTLIKNSNYIYIIYTFFFIVFLLTWIGSQGLTTPIIIGGGVLTFFYFFFIIFIFFFLIKYTTRLLFLVSTESIKKESEKTKNTFLIVFFLLEENWPARFFDYYKTTAFIDNIHYLYDAPHIIESLINSSFLIFIFFFFFIMVNFWYFLTYFGFTVVKSFRLVIERFFFVFVLFISLIGLLSESYPLGFVMLEWTQIITVIHEWFNEAFPTVLAYEVVTEIRDSFINAVKLIFVSDYDYIDIFQFNVPNWILLWEGASLSLICIFAERVSGNNNRRIPAVLAYFFISGFSSICILTGFLFLFLVFHNAEFMNIIHTFFIMYQNFNILETITISKEQLPLCCIGIFLIFFGFWIKLGGMPATFLMFNIMKNLSYNLLGFFNSFLKLVYVVIFLWFWKYFIFILPPSAIFFFELFFLWTGYLTLIISSFGMVLQNSNIKKFLVWANLTSIGLFGILLSYRAFSFIIIYFIVNTILYQIVFSTLMMLEKHNFYNNLKTNYLVSWSDLHNKNVHTGLLFLLIWTLIILSGVPPTFLFLIKYLVFTNIVSFWGIMDYFLLNLLFLVNAFGFFRVIKITYLLVRPVKAPTIAPNFLNLCYEITNISSSLNKQYFDISIVTITDRFMYLWNYFLILMVSCGYVFSGILIYLQLTKDEWLWLAT